MDDLDNNILLQLNSLNKSNIIINQQDKNIIHDDNCNNGDNDEELE